MRTEPEDVESTDTGSDQGGHLEGGERYRMLSSRMLDLTPLRKSEDAESEDFQSQGGGFADVEGGVRGCRIGECNREIVLSKH